MRAKINVHFIFVVELGMEHAIPRVNVQPKVEVPLVIVLQGKNNNKCMLFLIGVCILTFILGLEYVAYLHPQVVKQ